MFLPRSRAGVMGPFNALETVVSTYDHKARHLQTVSTAVIVLLVQNSHISCIRQQLQFIVQHRIAFFIVVYCLMKNLFWRFLISNYADDLMVTYCCEEWPLTVAPFTPPDAYRSFVRDIALWASSCSAAWLLLLQTKLFCIAPSIESLPRTFSSVLTHRTLLGNAISTSIGHWRIVMTHVCRLSESYYFFICFCNYILHYISPQ